MCFACCMCPTCVLGPCASQKRALNPWNWNYRWLGANTQTLGAKPRSVQEQQVLLTPKPSLQPPNSTSKLILLFLLMALEEP